MEGMTQSTRRYNFTVTQNLYLHVLTPFETKLTKYASSGEILLDVWTLFNAHWNNVNKSTWQLRKMQDICSYCWWKYLTIKLKPYKWSYESSKGKPKQFWEHTCCIHKLDCAASKIFPCRVEEHVKTKQELLYNITEKTFVSSVYTKMWI